MPTNNPSIHQLKRALEISEQIEKLQAEFATIFGGTSPAPVAKATPQPAGKTGRGKMSPEAREKIAAAARARWAKVKGTSPAVAKAPAGPKKKGGLTPEGRAKLAAAMKARWAARKKGAPAPTAPKATKGAAKAAPAKPAGKNAKRTVSPEARARMIAGAQRRWAAKKKA